MKSPDPRLTDDEWTEVLRNHLKSDFDLNYDEQVERLGRVKIQKVLPIQYFSFALVECRDMFVAGHYYGCITLCQSVAEGIAKFLIENNVSELQAVGASPNLDDGPYKLVSRLHRASVISEDARLAFLRVSGQDRNDFHHLNKTVPTDLKELEQRAEECLVALNVIESEVFAHDYNEVGSSRVDLQACKLEYSIVSPK